MHLVVCPFTPQLPLVLINRPRRDGTLSWRWYTAAVGVIRTRDLAIASPAPYHSATAYLAADYWLLLLLNLWPVHVDVSLFISSFLCVCRVSLLSCLIIIKTVVLAVVISGSPLPRLLLRSHINSLLFYATVTNKYDDDVCLWVAVCLSRWLCAWADGCDGSRSDGVRWAVAPQEVSLWSRVVSSSDLLLYVPHRSDKHHRRAYIAITLWIVEFFCFESVCLLNCGWLSLPPDNPFWLTPC